MSRIHDHITKSIGFLYPGGIAYEHGATAFLVGVPLWGWDKDRDPPQPLSEVAEIPHVTYLVTARHVIENFRSAGADSVVLRANTREGALERIVTAFDDWVLLPDDPNTGWYQDAAACRFTGTESAVALDFHFIPITWAALPPRIRDADIGIGEELWFPGHFRLHQGEKQNLPIVRTGSLAAMVNWSEPVEAKMPGGERRELAVHLIEARSTGGLSGSPIFCSPIGLRPDGSVLFIQKPGGRPYYLLGLLSGHWDWHYKAETEEERMNLGIAWATPAEKIVEVLEMPKFKDERDERAEEEKDKSPGVGTFDSGDLVSTEGQFLDDLQKATRRVDESPDGEPKRTSE